MANDQPNFSGTAFTGFPGGHDSVPGVGNVAPAATGTTSFGVAGNNVLGANLPHVDPNNFQGTVHWGPERVITGPQAGQFLPGGGAAGSGTGSN